MHSGPWIPDRVRDDKHFVIARCWFVIARCWFVIARCWFVIADLIRNPVAV